MTNRTLFSLLGGVTLMPMMGAAQTQRPNIIIMNIDDMGYSDPSCFGGDYVNTTNIDRLASEGLSLTQFYTACPISSPSRVGLTTACISCTCFSSHPSQASLLVATLQTHCCLSGWPSPSLPCSATFAASSPQSCYHSCRAADISSGIKDNQPTTSRQLVKIRKFYIAVR